ncbi:hypothetical protein Tco_1459290 [Tanacetum coccineum]
MNEEQRAQIARDEEIARQWDEEERQKAMAEAKSTMKIDWNDPSVISMEVKRRKSPEKMKSAEKMEEEDVATQKEMKEVSKETGAKRKKSIPIKSTRKRQNMEEDVEKEELKGFLDIIPREEVPIEVESLYTKFPVVDWKTCVLTENRINNKKIPEEIFPGRMSQQGLQMKVILVFDDILRWKLI